jgi:hypothetical protein
MFVTRPEDAARELARVCRKGGRLGLCTWAPGGTIEEWFQVMRPYMPPPPANPPPSPFEWGGPERLRELLGGTFDLEFEEGVTTLQMPNGKAVWDLFIEGYGPTRTRPLRDAILRAEQGWSATSLPLWRSSRTRLE